MGSGSITRARNATAAQLAQQPIVPRVCDEPDIGRDLLDGVINLAAGCTVRSDQFLVAGIEAIARKRPLPDTEAVPPNHQADDHMHRALNRLNVAAEIVEPPQQDKPVAGEAPLLS